MFEKLMYLLAPLIDKASNLWTAITGLFSKLPTAGVSYYFWHIICLILLSGSFLTNNTLVGELVGTLLNYEPGDWSMVASVVMLLAGSVSFTLMMFSLTFSRAYAHKLANEKTVWEVSQRIQKQIDLAESLRNAVIDASRFKLNEPPGLNSQNTSTTGW